VASDSDIPRKSHRRGFPTPAALVPGSGPAPNILYTGFTNANAMPHVANCVANAGRTESGDSYKFYAEGVTPAIAAPAALGDPICGPSISARPKRSSVRASAAKSFPVMFRTVSTSASQAQWVSVPARPAGVPPSAAFDWIVRWLQRGVWWPPQSIPQVRDQPGQTNDHDDDSDPHRPCHCRPPSVREPCRA
jgi:hypothetical protein